MDYVLLRSPHVFLALWAQDYLFRMAAWQAKDFELFLLTEHYFGGKAPVAAPPGNQRMERGSRERDRIPNIHRSRAVTP